MDIWLVILLSTGLPVTILMLFLLWKGKRTGTSDSIAAEPNPVAPETPEKKTATLSSSNPDSQSKDVGDFYDRTTDDFVKVYGQVIQAFRTRNLDNLLDYQIEAMGLEKGMTAIDAGCGICGPATYFAQKTGANIQAVTISKVQAEKSQANIDRQSLGAQVTVHHGDYHQLPAIFRADEADIVYFLESFGHSHDKPAAIDAAWKVLKPGGKLYIKDLFLKEPLEASHAPIMQREVDRINTAYHYHIADLYAVLTHLRKSGWILANLKTIDLPLEDFENLSISNEFQELTGIGRIDSWQDYIFPIEFYELVCIKPWTDPNVGNSRYFLQNMYYMQVQGKSAAEVEEMRMNPGEM